MQKYLIIIEKAENNYAAFSPDVPGCVATGATVEETLAEMKSALEFHLEGLDHVPGARGLRYYIESGELLYEDGSLFTELEIQPRIAA
jgi:predicted RNase H-like HicB family nuclease